MEGIETTSRSNPFARPAIADAVGDLTDKAKGFFDR
jgi:hypothetical protein